jgi:N-acylglucosamine 2-epimerase
MALEKAQLYRQYSDALLRDVLPFWEKHSLDPHGGFFTCLDRTGSVYDTDKFLWLQARQTWTFAMLYNRLERRPAWLDMAHHGAKFLRTFGRDEEGNFYFSLARDGAPLVQPYNVFSECFAAVAFSQYALAAGDDEAKSIALTAFRNMIRRENAPKGIYSKVFPGTRPLRSFAFPMMFLHVAHELEWLLPATEFEGHTKRWMDDIATLFIDRESGLVYENVSPDGSHPDTFEGRLINPGHGLEGMWFLMDAALRRGDHALANRAVDSLLRILEFSWDTEYGGIFGFLDARKRPSEKLEWDQKFWWAHIETLVALLMAETRLGRTDCRPWFEKVHEYTWSHYPDAEYGEWFGYLNRRGEVANPMKGGKWKGCYHVPRCLFMCAQMLRAEEPPQL